MRISANFPPHFRREAEELLAGCILAVASCRPGESSKPLRIDPPAERFLEQDARLRAFLTRYLDSDVEIQPQDVILRLCFYWSDFTEVLEFVGDPDRKEFFTTYHPHLTGGTVKITCCDASALFKDCYTEYGQVVGFSATLKPFEYYVRLSGLDTAKVKTAEFASPFPKDLRKLLIIPQISTKAIQAAGRVIRSETDRGLIVLMDSRFVEAGYSRSMPVDWFESDVKELVSDGILSEVADFWANRSHSPLP